MANWDVELYDDFHAEMQSWPEDARDELLAKARLLEEFGPTLKRPHADTLKGSKHANMKELRFDAADGGWRVAFALDPKRKAVLLVGGDNAGVKAARFYNSLIKLADTRFNKHLAELRVRTKES